MFLILRQKTKDKFGYDPLPSRRDGGSNAESPCICQCTRCGAESQHTKRTIYVANHRHLKFCKDCPKEKREMPLSATQAETHHRRKIDHGPPEPAFEAVEKVPCKCCGRTTVTTMDRYCCCDLCIQKLQDIKHRHGLSV
jgi:hypothetical protein